MFSSDAVVILYSSEIFEVDIWGVVGSKNGMNNPLAIIRSQLITVLWDDLCSSWIANALDDVLALHSCNLRNPRK